MPLLQLFKPCLRLGTVCRFHRSISEIERKRCYLPKSSLLQYIHGRHFCREGFKPSRRFLRPLKNDDRSNFGVLLRPFGFTLMVSGGSFGLCAIWQYENLKRVVRDAMKGTRGFTTQFYGKAGGLRNQINRWWNSLNSGEKLMVGIISCNVAVFGMWRIPTLSGFMYKFFSSQPNGGAPCLSMLFSTFSHHSFFHLAANMYVLWSFSSVIVSLLGKEQFLAMYISAGVISGFSSHLFKVVTGSMVPSLGASGAIMAVLGAVCTQHPDARLGIAFISDILPISFTAGSAQIALIAMDTLGMVFRWRLFDHAAHLGGMLFGMWYISYGHKMIWAQRQHFLKWWHKLREGDASRGDS